jgi:hypothetical protein
MGAWEIELRTRAKGRAASSRNTTVLSAVEAVFEPLARLLIEHGVSSPEAESLLRAVCVHQAAKIESARRTRPNVSRIALVTGVDRGEVRRILEGPPRVGSALETRRHRANRVLAAWHSDQDFIARGEPLVLPIKVGDRRRPSFWKLVRRYAPGVYPGLILGELCRVGAAEKLADGRVRVRMLQYKAKEFSDKGLNEMGSRARDLLHTMLSNATDASWPRICRVVETLSIDARFLPLIRKMLADRSEALLSGVKEELRSSRWKRTSPASPRVRIGLTVFSHEESPGEDKSHELTELDYAPRTRSFKSRGRARRKRAK